MKTLATLFFLSAGFSVLLTPLIGRLAVLLGAVDQPNARKIHREPVPRLGGIAIYLACVLPYPIVYLLGSKFAASEISRAWYPLMTFATLATAVMLLGALDDVLRLRAWQKLLVQITVGLLMYYAGFKIEVVTHPFGGSGTDTSIAVGPFSMIVTVLWLVGVMNAVNFLDGIDGLAAGVCAFVGVTMCVASLLNGRLLAALLCVSIVGASMGFLRYNFHPASIFMGDSGSLFLGFSLATISLYGAQKSTAAVGLLVPMVALGVPLWDALLAVGRRVANGRSVFAPDAEHIHHRLLRLGLTQRRVTFLLYGVTAVLCIAAVAIMISTQRESIIILLMLGAFTYFVSSRLQLKEMGVDVISLASRAAKKIGASAGAETLWENVAEAVHSLKVDALEVFVVREGVKAGQEAVFEWHAKTPREPEKGETTELAIKFPVNQHKRKGLVLRAVVARSSQHVAAIGIIGTSIAEAIADWPESALEEFGKKLPQASHTPR